MSGFYPNDLSYRIEKTVAWLDEYYLGPILRGACLLLLAAVPSLEAWAQHQNAPKWLDTFNSPWWLLVILGAFLGLIPLQHFHERALVSRVIDSLAQVHGSFAGSLWSLGQKVSDASRGKLEDAQCEALCSAMLHRIRDFTAIALAVGRRPKLRATLAVPYARTAGGAIDALRVWCYDETHQERGFTTIPLYTGNEVAPGAPAAYLSGALQIVADIRKVPGPASALVRPYVSIFSIPLAARSPDGKPLAVVSVDADQAGFFDPRRVAEDVRPLVEPVVNGIGLVLLSRRKKGHPYEFPR